MINFKIEYRWDELMLVLIDDDKVFPAQQFFGGIPSVSSMYFRFRPYYRRNYKRIKKAWNAAKLKEML